MSVTSLPEPIGRSWRLIALVAVVYYAAARLGLLLAFPNTNSSPVWPPSGIAFAAVLMLGYRVWPGIMLAAFLANFLTLPLSWPGLAASVGISAGNTLEAVGGVFLLRRMGCPRDPLQRSQDVFRFVAAALLACLVSCTNGPTWLCLFGIVPWTLYKTIWFTWWLGDAAGILILTPVLVSWWQLRDVRLSKAKLLEAGVMFGLLTAVAELLLGGWFFAAQSLKYLVVPGLAWSAFRFGQRETSIMAALFSAIAIGHTVQYTGSFVEIATASVEARAVAKVSRNELLDPEETLKLADVRNNALLFLQIFVCSITVISAALTAAVEERNRSEDDLRALNATLEQRVAERTAELERSNQELDDFAYVASHDLKEPLRGIFNYANFLVEDHGDTLADDAKSRLATIQRLTGRMEELIETLLQFSRVGRVELAITDTDLNEVLASVLESVQVGLELSRIEIRIPRPLPILRCDHVRVTEVFRNLITNAMKYNDKPERWIEIGTRGDGHSAVGDSEPHQKHPAALFNGQMVFYVRDNGIGIPEKHRDAVFRIFKRLHGRDQFGGGTGAGLTIAKKIVERHGGRIWIESTPGLGTTFLFTLQREPNEIAAC